MNKKDLVDQVAENMGMTKKDAGMAVQTVIDTIFGAVTSGDKVSLVGFGVFEAVKRNARKCRNLQTGEEMTVPEKFAPKFRPSKNMKVVTAQLPIVPEF